jgi:hypothetical protein
MSGFRSDRKSAREPAVTKKPNVLKSASELAWKFQTWTTDTELEFKTRKLHGYLDGSISSIFDSPQPAFGWVMEITTFVKTSEVAKSKSEGGATFDLEDEDSDESHEKRSRPYGGFFENHRPASAHTPPQLPTPPEPAATPSTEPFPKSSRTPGPARAVPMDTARR